MPRSFHRDSYTHADNHEPLERGADGHVIHDLIQIDRSRMEKIKRSPEAQYAIRIGHVAGMADACTLWVVAGFVASYFGVCAPYVGWAIFMVWLAYMLWPRYIDFYPSLKRD